MLTADSYENLEYLVVNKDNTFSWRPCSSQVTFNLDKQTNQIISIESNVNTLTSPEDFPKVFRSVLLKDKEFDAPNTFWLLIKNNELYRSYCNIFTNRVEKATKVSSKDTPIRVESFLEQTYPNADKTKFKALLEFEDVKEKSTQKKRTTAIEKTMDELVPAPEALSQQVVGDESIVTEEDIRPADKPYFETLLPKGNVQIPTIQPDEDKDDLEDIQLAIALSLAEQSPPKSVIENYLHLLLTNKAITNSILLGLATSVIVCLAILALNPASLVTATCIGIASGLLTGTTCFFGLKHLPPLRQCETIRPTDSDFRL